MEIGSIVFSVALAIVSLAYGLQKVQLSGKTWPILRGRGYKAKTVRSIGAGQIVIAVLLIGGIFFAPLGVVGCLGTIAVYIWGVGQHVTYGDYGNPDVRNRALIPLAILALSVVTLVMVIASS